MILVNHVRGDLNDVGVIKKLLEVQVDLILSLFVNLLKLSVVVNDGVNWSLHFRLQIIAIPPFIFATYKTDDFNNNRHNLIAIPFNEPTERGMA